MLGGTRAGDHTESGLELTKDRRLTRGKAHVARQYELAANATYATCDLCNADEPTGAQMTKQLADRRFAGEPRCRLPVLFDSGHIDVGYEIVGISAPEHEYLYGVIGFGSLNERHQIANQFRP